MKRIVFAALVFLKATAVADERVALGAGSGRFEVVQEYAGEFIESIRFRDPDLPAVRLEGFPWPGVYSLSPDERWLLRTQKTGSGDNIAKLYRIEENGRVFETIGFDDLLWRASDGAARLAKTALYHTGVSDCEWGDDGRSLELVLRGSDAAKSGGGIVVRLVYEPDRHKVTVRSTGVRDE